MLPPRPAPYIMIAAITAAWGLGACGDEGAGPTDTSADTGAPCQRDDVDEPAGAIALTAEGVEGWLCPVGDVDWYRFETGPDDHILRVTLAMEGDLSPVEAAYVVWSIGPDGAPAEVVAATPPQRIGLPLDELHCVAPGDYLVAVRDDGEDAQDFRRPYTLALSATTDPDPAEPNDDAAGAAPLAEGGTGVEGAIACVGDTDWYGFDVGAGELVQLRLTMPVAAIAPALRLVDGDGALVAARDNPSGTVRETDLTLEAVLPAAGRYYAVVADGDGREADPTTTYRLALTLADDSDTNEPNGHPEVATALTSAAASCGPAWGAWFEATGNIGAPGDNDWFVVPLTGCAPQGVIEAEVELLDQARSAADRWALAGRVQLALTIVRDHAQSPCASDLVCQALGRPCDNGFDCSGLSNTCLPDGFCAGAGVCLPGGRCGANVIQRRFTPPAPPTDPSATPPPPHRVAVTTPIFADERLHLRVADFQSDGADRAVSYRVRARVRAEVDANEPSNVFDTTLLEDFPVAIQAGAARPIPIHDCTTDGVSAPDCCGPDTWIEGALSYENDLDFYRYPHPCPGEDCNLRVLYEMDAGPVDFVLSVYAGHSLWFGGVAGARDEAPSQAAVSGAYGGTQACFYAYQGHQGEPFDYYVALRDLAAVRDWSSDQRYRFCVERTTRACESPCRLYDNGCGQP
ncbi:MAG: PPC domain-containing protein [Deltaproteobacteria bacterium]|nr:PPC domain-containing protein [Deltaproteobacteria bacterium]